MTVCWCDTLFAPSLFFEVLQPDHKYYGKYYCKISCKDCKKYLSYAESKSKRGLYECQARMVSDIHPSQVNSEWERSFMKSIGEISYRRTFTGKQQECLKKIKKRLANLEMAVSMCA